MSILQELAEASGSNKLSDQMILFFEREVAEDLKSIEDFTEMCKMLTDQVSDRHKMMKHNHALVPHTHLAHAKRTAIRLTSPSPHPQPHLAQNSPLTSPGPHTQPHLAQNSPLTSRSR